MQHSQNVKNVLSWTHSGQVPSIEIASARVEQTTRYVVLKASYLSKSLRGLIVIGSVSLLLNACASVSNPSTAGTTFPAKSGYLLAGGGSAQFDPDTQDGQLTVAEDSSATAHLGLGYQFSSIAAVELRLADLGEVVYDDDRTLGYKVADLSGVLTWRQRHVSLFGRLGIGTFQNDGDFDVELDSAAHPVFGAGLAYHATSNLDFRLSVSAHDADAVWGSVDAVWRFGRSSANRSGSNISNNNSAFDANVNEGYQSIEPLRASSELETGREETSNAEGLLIDSEPSIEFTPVPEVVPEPAPQRDPINTPAAETVAEVETPAGTITEADEASTVLIADSSDTVNSGETLLVTNISDALSPELENSSYAEFDGEFIADEQPSIEPDADTDSEVLVDAVNNSEVAAVADVQSTEPDLQVNEPESDAADDADLLTIEPSEIILAEVTDGEINDSATESKDDPAASLVVAAIDPQLNAIDENVNNSLIVESPADEADAYVSNSLLPIAPFQFNQGGTALLEPSLENVDDLVALLTSNPDLKLAVEAHAAPGGDPELNMLLSRRRALTMIRLLVDRGVSAQRLRPRAFGDTSPLSDATQLELNDRVELRVR